MKGIQTMQTMLAEFTISLGWWAIVKFILVALLTIYIVDTRRLSNWNMLWLIPALWIGLYLLGWVFQISFALLIVAAILGGLYALLPKKPPARTP
jgi:hypothetical protein